MFSLWLVLWVLLIHWFADFVLQKNEWSMAKSSSNIALGKHVAVYSAALFVFVIPIISVLQTEHSTSSWLTSVFLWAAFNGVMHFGVDYITSRVNKSLYEQNRIHDFFVSVGFDQWVHFFFLFTSYAVLVQ